MANSLSKKERLDCIVDKCSQGVKRRMAKSLGINEVTLSKWFSRNYLDPFKLKAAFPELNAEWLLTGEGEMMKAEAEKEELQEQEPIKPLTLEIQQNGDQWLVKMI